MGFFVNGMSPKVRPAVEQIRKETLRNELAFSKLVQKLRTECNIVRSRSPNILYARTDNSGKKIFYLSETPAPEALPSRADEQLLYLPEGSDEPADMPTTLGDGFEELFIAQRAQMTVQPANIPYGSRKTIPTRGGWTDNSMKSILICYLCYAKNDHTSTQCTLSMSNMQKVILN